MSPGDVNQRLMEVNGQMFQLPNSWGAMLSVPHSPSEEHPPLPPGELGHRPHRGNPFTETDFTGFLPFPVLLHLLLTLLRGSPPTQTTSTQILLQDLYLEEPKLR